MDMDKLVSLCKRRGFIFPSSEIYGGINGFWDYGPLGRRAEAKHQGRLVARQRHACRDDMVGLDCSIIMNPKVWEASGHVGGFSDPMVDCRAEQGPVSGRSDLTSSRTSSRPVTTRASRPRPVLAGLGEDARKPRRDSPTKKIAKLSQAIWPSRPASGHSLICSSTERSRAGHRALSDRRSRHARPSRAHFNLMFETYVGAVGERAKVAYLRPETAQGIFVNFKNVVDTGRVKIPFGIAQVGKSFRNEINPRNFTFRSREFEQMEIEFFCHPEESADWYKYWRDTRFKWYVDLGLQSDRLRLRDHDPDELAFYSTARPTSSTASRSASASWKGSRTAATTT